MNEGELIVLSVNGDSSRSRRRLRLNIHNINGLQSNPVFWTHGHSVLLPLIHALCPLCSCSAALLTWILVGMPSDDLGYTRRAEFIGSYYHSLYCVYTSQKKSKVHIYRRKGIFTQDFTRSLRSRLSTSHSHLFLVFHGLTRWVDPKVISHGHCGYR